MLPADYYAVRVEDAHLPLIVMLVLTQLSVGACFVTAALYAGPVSPALEAVRSWKTVTAVVFGLLALGASTMHLGRPHLAWRAVLGLRSSWLSREIVAFGLFAGAATAQASCVLFWPQLASELPAVWSVLQGGVLVTGLLGVFCSVMIYHWTRRPTWVGQRTFLRFFGTAAWLGIAATIFAAGIAAAVRTDLQVSEVMPAIVGRLGLPLIFCAGAKLLYEALDFLHLLERHHTPQRRLAALMTDQLAGLTLARFALGLLGGVILPWALLNESPTASGATWFATVTAVFALSLIGELLERTLFFMTAVAPRMPGAIRT
jgi:DMSO reductase anchor subunit